jgi:hypothetical protein
MAKVKQNIISKVGGLGKASKIGIGAAVLFLFLIGFIIFRVATIDKTTTVTSSVSTDRVGAGGQQNGDGTDGSVSSGGTRVPSGGGGGGGGSGQTTPSTTPNTTKVSNGTTASSNTASTVTSADPRTLLIQTIPGGMDTVSMRTFDLRNLDTLSLTR